MWVMIVGDGRLVVTNVGGGRCEDNVGAGDWGINNDTDIDISMLFLLTKFNFCI